MNKSVNRGVVLRIGILKFHNANNYGAVLQCYALQSFLSHIGHDVEVIDYDNEQILKAYNPFYFDDKSIKGVLSTAYNFDLKLARKNII